MVGEGKKQLDLRVQGSEEVSSTGLRADTHGKMIEYAG